jgi:hypothetical protein
MEAHADIGVEAFARWNGEASQRLPLDGHHTLALATSSADPATSIEVTILAGAFVS